MAFEPKRNMEAELEAEVYQGSASPHSVIVKHINQVLAAEHKHMVEYQREQEQIQVERRVRHERERTQLAAQAHSINPIITNTNESIPLDAIKDDDMNLKQFAVAAMTAGALTAVTISAAGCDNRERYKDRLNEQNQFEYDKKVNPVLYKVKVSLSNALNEFEDTAHFSVTYDIANESCLPLPDNWLSGSISIQTQNPVEYQLHKANDGSYYGMVAFDAFENRDYFGNGLCNIRLIGASVSLRSLKHKEFVVLDIGKTLQKGRNEWAWSDEGFFEKKPTVGYFKVNDLMPVESLNRASSLSEAFSITAQIVEDTK
jgi:hypothetical protein